MPDERESIDVIRISVLREYLSADEKLRQTPAPFAEFRVFSFRKTVPQRIYLQIIMNTMKLELERMERLFQSIDLVKNRLPAQSGRQYVMWQDKEEAHMIQARKIVAGQAPKIIINGHEIEEISTQEVLQFFKSLKKRIKLGEIYRYACFYDTSGNIKAEYDEEQIQRLEAQFGIGELFEEE
jgi:hypothetical protein